MDDEIFYKFTPPKILKLTGSLGFNIREQIARKFIRISGIDSDAIVLDVGVTSDENHISNVFEYVYPYKQNIIGVGLADASHLKRLYPGFQFLISDGKQLALKDCSVDHVFSHAVIEHVGSRIQQAKFIAELLRVSRKGVFITTPNRWFPVEVHVFLPFLHYLPASWFRKILRVLKKAPFHSEEALNLLSRNDLTQLCRQNNVSVFQIYKQRLLGFASNLLLYIPKNETP